MKAWERMFITLILCLTLLAAVWLHGRLNRYGVVVRASSDIGEATRYDGITGRVWVMHDEHAIELGVERDKQGDNRKKQPEIELLYPKQVQQLPPESDTKVDQKSASKVRQK